MPAPDVQGLANYVVTSRHLIRGDRMSLYGDNLASATALSVGGHSCTILGTTSGTFFGYDTITFDVPVTLRPNRPDGTVSVSVTNADGTWTSGGTVTFKVARGGDWVQPADVASTLPVRQFLEYAGPTDTSAGAVLTRLVDPAEWVGGPDPSVPDVGLWTAAHREFVPGDTWAALSSQTIFALYEHYWTKTNTFPSDPFAGGALGYETEPQSTQDFTGTGTVNYPATVELRLAEAIITAEWYSEMTGTYDDNTVDDPPVDWGAPDTTLEVRQVPNSTITAVETSGAHPRQTASADPVMPTDAAGDPLLTSASIEPLVIADFPDRRLTFTVAETDFTASTVETGGQFTFALLLDRWTTESWYGFPSTPTDAEIDSEGRIENRRRVQASIDTVTATATYTPIRYRFVYEVPGGNRPPLRQRQTSTGIHTGGTPLRQRQHHFGLRQRQTGI